MNSYDYSIFRPLEERPTATTITVRELLKRVTDGYIRIPEFQRPLRWKSQDVLQLLDSLWRGYPVGDLVFWKRKAEAGTLRIGTCLLEVPARADAWWVVDGQQRITALAATLLELQGTQDPRWQAWFNPGADGFTETPGGAHALPGFLPGPVPTASAGVWVPVSKLGDLKRLGRWQKEAHVTDAQWELIEDVQQRILDYAIPSYVMATNDEAALRGIFSRLNATGVRMRAEEVFHALLGPATAKKEGLELSKLQECCDQDGFGQPSKGEVMKAVLAISGQDPSRRPEHLPLHSRASLASQDACEQALVATTSFLKSTCGIVHNRLLPYPVVLVILARWFHLFPETPDDARDRLARWVWRGALTGVHQRAAVSKMREQLFAIHNEGDAAMRASLERLERFVGDDQRGGGMQAPWKLERFNLRSARSRLEVLALLSLNPSQPNGPVSLRALLDDEGRLVKEVFASRDWKHLQGEDRVLASTVANRVLLEDGHTGVHVALKNWGPDQHRDALASQLLGRECFEALRANQPASFLRARAEAIQTLMVSFFEAKLGWNRPDLRPASEYMDAEDMGSF